MRTLIASLFRDAAVTIEAATSLVDDQLWPDEWAYIRSSVPKRRAEFGTARVAARKGLASMGFPAMSLTPREDRSPVWPAGVVGSIAHTNDFCAVVLDRNPPMLAVGLDIEQLRALDAGTMDLVLTRRERAWLEAQGDEVREDLALLVFSAKEAYYKCQHPISATFLEFEDVEIDVDRATDRFLARALRVGLPASVRRLEGRFAFARGMVMCGVELYA